MGEMYFVDEDNNEPLTPEEFRDKMQSLHDELENSERECLDMEEIHIIMDGVMCSLLEDLGYGEGVEIFLDTPKWYA